MGDKIDKEMGKIMEHMINESKANQTSNSDLTDILTKFFNKIDTNYEKKTE